MTRLAARARRSTARLLTTLTYIKPLRPVGELGMRLLFDQVAERWDAIRRDPAYRASLHVALDELPQRRGDMSDNRRELSAVLDVACGTGLATRMLVDQFPRARVSGIDIAPAMIELAQHAVPEADFVIGSSWELPYDDHTFELVVALDGVFDISELVRVTSPGGAIVIVYSLGGMIPVRRDVAELASALAKHGLETATRADAAWVVWAWRPAPV